MWINLCAFVDHFACVASCIESVNEKAGEDCGYRVHLPDFEGLSASGASRAGALEAAGVLLLRTLANAAQRGERVPRPGDLPEGRLERVMIHPLMSTA